MNRLLAIAAFAVPLGISFGMFPLGVLALVVWFPILAVSIFLIKRADETGVLVQIFVAAFLIRIIVAALIVGFDLQGFFGEDSLVHEFNGYQIAQYWAGEIERPVFMDDWAKPWGLHGLVGAIYLWTGRNAPAINFLSCLAGALTSVFIYLTASKVFRNRQVATLAALMTAFSPAMIIWSTQIMKDGFVVFLVVAVIYFLVKLQERFSWLDTVFLLGSLSAIVSLRFYVFYFASFACIGSFLFGSKRIMSQGIRWLGILSATAVMLAYTGVLTTGSEQIERLSDLEQIQYSRTVLSQEAASGYSSGTDITTPTGAILALPVGLANLLLSPFPWQFTSVRSMLPLPEMIIWWFAFPLIFVGLKYTLKNRFREAIPLMLFTITLTVAYALFQTNIGTAYRQRTQIQVFLFIFIAAGWTLLKERRDDRNAMRVARSRAFEKRLQARAQS